MSSRSSELAAGLLVLTLVAGALLAAAPLAAADGTEAYAGPDDISVSPSANALKLNAGESKLITLDIYNKSAKTLAVYVDFDNTDDIAVEFPADTGNRVQVDPGQIGCVQLRIVVDQYATTTDHSLSFRITINDPDRGSPILATASDLVKISVHSDLSAGASYNKLLGLWANPLPAPFDSPLCTTLISFLVWIVIAVAAAYFIAPVIVRVWSRGRRKAADVVADVTADLTDDEREAKP